MAKVIHQENQLQKEYKHKRRLEILFCIPMVLAFALWMWNVISIHNSDPSFVGPVFAVFGIFGAIARYFKQKADIMEAGLSGERMTSSALSCLDDSYTILSNVQLRTESGQAELDNLVIGPNGIFIVETKNYRGTLTGNCRDKTWVKYEVSPGGAEDTRMVKNPIPQVKRQAWILNQYLCSHDIHLFVNGLVYFSNVDLEYCIQGEDPHAHVFFASQGGTPELRAYIEDSASAHLSEDQIRRVLSVIHQANSDSSPSRKAA